MYRLDESGQFILPIASLIRLAQMLPKSSADLPRLVHPVPPEVRRNSKVLIELIKKGCEAPDAKDNTLYTIYEEVCGEVNHSLQDKSNQQNQQNQQDTSGMKEVDETPLIYDDDVDNNKMEENVLNQLMKEGIQHLQKPVQSAEIVLS